MEDEEILQLISDQRARGKNDTQIGRVLRLRGVSDIDSYLKKKRRYFDLGLQFGRGKYGVTASYSSSGSTRAWFFGFTCSSTGRV